MNIPTPEFNTGLGFHYFPDDAHYRTVDAQSWVPELKALGASWLTLVGSPTRAIPEPFIRALIDSAIEPIIHINVPPSEPADLKALEPLYESYAKWGAHYVVLYDQPNTRRGWPIDMWATSGLVGRFVDLLLPALQLASDSGLVPVFPPLKQGGDYWDTAFLDSALTLLKQRGQTDLLKELIFAHYAFAFNRPPEWGVGGAARWPRTKPYSVPPGSQDQRGFRSFEWYQDVIKARLGEPRPLLMIAGGARIGDAEDLDYPAVDQTRHATCNIEIMKAMFNRHLPAYMVNVAFWLLSAPKNTLAEATAWYKADGSTLPSAGAMKQQVAEATREVAALEKRIKKPAPHRIPTIGTAKTPLGKPIFHYLLLPTFEWGVSDWHYTAAMDYIHKFQPTCGFSTDEARAAEYVTIIGNEQGVSAEIEHTLRTAGCKVDRVCGRDGMETQHRLSEMARTGTRFLSVEVHA